MLGKDTKGERDEHWLVRHNTVTKQKIILILYKPNICEHPRFSVFFSPVRWYFSFLPNERESFEIIAAFISVISKKKKIVGYATRHNNTDGQVSHKEKTYKTEQCGPVIAHERPMHFDVANCKELGNRKTINYTPSSIFPGYFFFVVGSVNSVSLSVWHKREIYETLHCLSAASHGSQMSIPKITKQKLLQYRPFRREPWKLRRGPGHAEATTTSPKPIENPKENWCPLFSVCVCVCASMRIANSRSIAFLLLLIFFLLNYLRHTYALFSIQLYQKIMTILFFGWHFM